MKLTQDIGPIHFVGIGGIGMSGIAEVMATLGYTVQGSDIAIEVVDGAVILNGVTMVVATDIEASNGVIHVIDSVLLP